MLLYLSENIKSKQGGMYIKTDLFSKKEKDLEEILHLKPYRYGWANRDKLIYLIREENEMFGFFALCRVWIEYLYLADICGYTPVIYVGKNCLYYDVDKKANVFENYFDQPADVTYKETKKSCRVIHSGSLHRNMIELTYTGKYNSYVYNDEYICAMGRIAGKYIKYNQSTKEYIQKGLEYLGFQGQKTLGIHVRGTDFNSRYNNHPVPVLVSEVVQLIDEVLNKKEYEKIFVATDDEKILMQLKKQYGDKLSYYKDVFRGNSNKSVAFTQSKRKYHKYLLGLEVLRDMHTLSMCDSLIAGISQVAICAQITKSARDEKYQYIKIIDKGVNQNHRYLRRKS